MTRYFFFLLGAAMLQAQSAALVTGRVTDGGAAVPSARVTAIASSAGVRMQTADTDEQGRFRLTVPSGRITLVAHADGYASQTADVDVQPGRSVPSVNLLLVRAGAVSGIVVDTTGSVVPGARVWLSYRGETRAWSRGEEAGGEEADGLGRFIIPVVRQGRPFVLHAEADDWLMSSSSTLQLRAGELSGVMLVLTRRGTSVSGRVVDANGRPVAGTAVHLRAMPAQSEFSDDQRSSVAFARSTQRETVTAADGSYRFSGIPAGRVVLSADSARMRGHGEAATSGERESRVDITVR